MPVRMAANLEGTHVAALRDDTVTLFLVSSAEQLARASAPGSDGTIVFCGRQVLVHAREATRSVLTALSVPKLELISQLELDSPTRLLATTGIHALIDRGVASCLAQCTQEATAVAPLMIDATFDHAVGLQRPQFMTWGSRGGEIWDAQTRRPSAKVALTLPNGVRAMGLAGQQRSLWITTEAAELFSVRISDGRTSAIRLSGAPDEVCWHPQSSWMVLDIAGASYVANLALRTCERVDLPRGDARALVPAGNGAHLIVLEHGQLSVWPVSSDAGDPAEVRRGGGLTLSVDAIAPHEPVWSPPPTAARAPTPPAAVPQTRPVTVSERLAARRPAASPPPAPSPSPLSSPPPAPSPAPPRVARPAVAAPAPTGSAWRDALLDWARPALAGVAPPPWPLLPATTLGDLTRRAGLGPAAGRVLHALYAEWLDGRGDTGVAGGSLAAAGGSDDDAWSEALGTGHLAALGLIACELGRTRLVPSVGVFLDGRAPRCAELLGAIDPPEVPPGVFRVAGLPGETARATAHRLARGLGALGFAELDGQPARSQRQWAEQSRLECWMRRRVLVTAIDVGVSEPRPGETLLLVVPDGAAEAPGGPPWWRDAAA